MAAFRCPNNGSGGAPLYADPTEVGATPVRRVAVAAHGSVLQGLVEPCGEELWLCVVLATGNPLLARGLQSCWARVGGCRGLPPPAGSLEWVGLTHVKTVRSMLDLQWDRPFYLGDPVTYAVDMQPEGGEWGTVWTTEIGEECGSARIEVTLRWPCSTERALLRVVAKCEPWSLTSTPVAVHNTMAAGLSGNCQRPLGISEAVVTTAQGDKLCCPLRSALALQGIVDRATMLRQAARYVPRSPFVHTAKHIVRRRSPRVLAPSRLPRRKVLVMGLYHSCTSALVLELRRRFCAEVVNDDPRKHGATLEGFWKHRVHRQRPCELDEDTLVVLMVKEPCFWLQSVARCFYQVHPVIQHRDGAFHDVPSRGMEDLFGHVEHDQIIYPNAAALWSDTVSSYLDDSIFPPHTSVVVRAEDFIFSFDAVMDELGAMGLEEKSHTAAPYRPEPLVEPIKAHARSRCEALAFYGNANNRRGGFSAVQLLDVDDEVDPEIAQLLGYGTGAVETWISVES